MEKNRPKKVKYINKFELTVSLKEKPIITEMPSGIGAVTIKVGKAQAQWEGLNYTTLSVYPTEKNPILVTQFAKLKQGDTITCKGKIYNRYNIIRKKPFFSLEVLEFEKITVPKINKQTPKKTNNKQKVIKTVDK